MFKRILPLPHQSKETNACSPPLPTLPTLSYPLLPCTSQPRDSGGRGGARGEAGDTNRSVTSGWWSSCLAAPCGSCPRSARETNSLHLSSLQTGFAGERRVLYAQHAHPPLSDRNAFSPRGCLLGRAWAAVQARWHTPLKTPLHKRRHGSGATMSLFCSNQVICCCSLLMGKDWGLTNPSLGLSDCLFAWFYIIPSLSLLLSRDNAMKRSKWRYSIKNKLTIN